VAACIRARQLPASAAKVQLFANIRRFSSEYFEEYFEERKIMLEKFNF
jgi:hypothetical protein